MKQLVKLFSLVLIGVLVFTGCNDCENPVPQPINNSVIKIVFGLYNGADSITYNDVIAVDNVNEFRMDFFKYYLSNFKIQNSKGENVFLKDVEIVNPSKLNGSEFTYAAPAGSYEKFMVGIGLDQTLNASDPVSFEQGHPLSAAEAMYWSWAAKYRFVRIDGKANENAIVGDTTDLLIAYHPGADDFYDTRTFEKPFVLVEGETTELVINLDMAKVFDGPGGAINVPTEPQTHTAPDDYDLAVKFSKNFVAAFDVK